MVAVLLLPVVDAGDSVTVTFAGWPPAVRFTAPVKLVRVIVIALVPLAPCPIVAGAADSVKFAPVTTVRLRVAVREPVIPVAVPVIVIGYVPAGTAAPTVT